MKLYMVLKTTETFQNSEADQQAQDETHPDLRVDDDLKECEDEEELPKRRQKISQNEEKYNTQMVEQTTGSQSLRYD